MLLNFRTCLLALILAFEFGSLAAQDGLNGQFKRRLYDADQLFDDGNYLRAFAIYDSLWDMRPNDVYLQFKTGASLVFKQNHRDEAFDILKDLKNDPDFPEATYYMARAKHFNYQFEEAINLYNEYLEFSKASGLQRI